MGRQTRRGIVLVRLADVGSSQRRSEIPVPKGMSITRPAFILLLRPFGIVLRFDAILRQPGPLSLAAEYVTVPVSRHLSNSALQAESARPPGGTTTEVNGAFYSGFPSLFQSSCAFSRRAADAPHSSNNRTSADRTAIRPCQPLPRCRYAQWTGRFWRAGTGGSINAHVQYSAGLVRNSFQCLGVFTERDGGTKCVA